nr:class II glutamine amidotransferase [Spirochaetaceae bacterium]
MENICNMDFDKLHEECGIVGIYLNKKEANDFNAARMTYYGLYSLQHRGQESAGIAVMNDGEVEQHKGMGLVSEVFTAEKLEEMRGQIAVGHVLYSTCGEAHIENAQPFVNRFKLGSIAVAHNGTLVNYLQLKEFLEETGSTFLSSSDSEVIIKLIAKNYKKGLEKALTDTIQMIKGSFALAVMTDNCLIGARDPHGIRPLCLGKVENGWVLASESCALDAIGAELVRDIRPGEIVIINDDGVLSFEFGEHTAKQTCIFEYVYFARPDSKIFEQSCDKIRRKMGKQLAKECPVDADIVIPVPDS